MKAVAGLVVLGAATLRTGVAVVRPRGGVSRLPLLGAADRCKAFWASHGFGALDVASVNQGGALLCRTSLAGLDRSVAFPSARNGGV